MIKDLSIFTKKEVMIMGGLGFSAGLPIMLVFSTLSVWLVKAGVERSTVTLFSWAGFAYSFKFLWSPIVDKFQIPLLHKIGHRKSWLLITQILIFFSIILTSYSDPQNNLKFMAFAIVLIAFFSATQDIVIDAFRIESAPEKKQGPLASMYLAGYRIAMIVSGAGSLWLASIMSDENYQTEVWKNVYQIIGFFMIIGFISTALCKEPTNNKVKKINYKNQLKFTFSTILSILIFFVFFLNIPEVKVLNHFYNFFYNIFKIVFSFGVALISLLILEKINFLPKKQSREIFINPIIDFFKRYKKIALMILLLIGLYRIADVVMGVMANIFYLEKGYEIKDIATFSKFFGLIATILGGILGGTFAMKFGTYKSLLIGAITAALTNVLFAFLAIIEKNLFYLATIIIADNLASGFAGAAFVVYLSSLTSIKFTATQYALFTSLMLFIPKLIAGYAGGIVDVIDYPSFFIFTAVLGFPVIFLIIFLNKRKL
ncbi:MAG: MFS transporter [Pelagibacteraceae bacterium]|jgi:PAT family beta-lactamase induction signal transducer AmpG|uniref:AmpG family muropeptide MFS transporter n=1 Tax=Candidatus Pelagibacter sp. HIMB109 TaxID=3415412 RepID=UPI003121BBD0